MKIKEERKLPQEYARITCEIDNNEIDLPDGYYRVVCRGYDWSKAYKLRKQKNFFSETLVPVRGKLISIKELIQATIEVKHATGYHGNYLESVEYCPLTRCLQIYMGS